MAEWIYIEDVTLPDGRVVHAHIEGHTEWDTNAGIEDKVELTWPDGKELTGDEYNEEMVVGGQRYYLHEYVTEQAVQGTPEWYVDED